MLLLGAVGSTAAMRLISSGFELLLLVIVLLSTTINRRHCTTAASSQQDDYKDELITELDLLLPHTSADNIQV